MGQLDKTSLWWNEGWASCCIYFMGVPAWCCLRLYNHYCPQRNQLTCSRMWKEWLDFISLSVILSRGHVSRLYRLVPPQGFRGLKQNFYFLFCCFIKKKTLEKQGVNIMYIDLKCSMSHRKHIITLWKDNLHWDFKSRILAWLTIFLLSIHTFIWDLKVFSHQFDVYILKMIFHE